jgi:membrane fusion protein, multidrug efflux system
MRHVASLLLVAALTVAGCAKKEAPPEVVRPVQLAPVVIGAMAETAVFAGEVKPRHETDLAFRIGGKIVERRVDVGATVKKGQVLARLDPADVALQAQAAEAAVAAARTDSDFARAELERYQNLFQQKFVSESALDQKQNTMRAAGARLQQAQANLAVNHNQTGYATLIAPDDGVVTSITAEAGQVVASAQPVMKLARTDEREVAIAVPENRIGELKGAQRINVMLLASPRRLFTGRVREISPAVDPVTRTFSVRVAVPDADASLSWGMTANVVAVAAGSGQNALIPLTSIYHEPDGRPAVWVYDAKEQKVSLRAIELGPFREDGVVITRGLNHGEWIVAAGVNKLQPGQTVKPYEAPGKPAPPAPAAPASATPAPVAVR